MSNGTRSHTRGARSRIEHGIETTVVPDTMPKTTIRTLSSQNPSTSIVIPRAADAERVRDAIAQYGIEIKPWGASFLVKARATAIHAALDRVGITSRITDPININRNAA